MLPRRRRGCRAASGARTRCGSAARSRRSRRVSRAYAAAQVLLVELRGGVDVAGIERCGLRDRRRARAGARTPGSVGSNCRHRDRRRCAGAGSTCAVLGAAVAALAVDDHAAGQHDAARRSRPRCRAAEQHRGAQVVVVRRRRRRRPKSTPSPTIAAWWQTASTPSTPPSTAPASAASPSIELDGGIEVVRPPACAAGRSRSSTRPRARLDELVDDVRADEPGASGNENHEAPQPRAWLGGLGPQFGSIVSLPVRGWPVASGP